MNFEIARYRGRQKKVTNESLKFGIKKEDEYSYDEESLENSVETIGDVDKRFRYFHLFIWVCYQG
jgi:hypothetical protein